VGDGVAEAPGVGVRSRIGVGLTTAVSMLDSAVAPIPTFGWVTGVTLAAAAAFMVAVGAPSVLLLSPQALRLNIRVMQSTARSDSFAFMVVVLLVRR
jgi:hypothetical protein